MQLPSQRLTDRARKVLQGAENEASRLGANTVEPIHVIVAMTHAPACVAAIVLLRLGVDLERLRLEAEVEALACSWSGAMQSDSREAIVLQDLIRRAFDCADERNTPWVGTEHLLLAALEGSSACAAPLARLGIDLPACTAELERYLVDGLAP